MSRLVNYSMCRVAFSRSYIGLAQLQSTVHHSDEAGVFRGLDTGVFWTSSVVS